MKEIIDGWANLGSDSLDIDAFKTLISSHNPERYLLAALLKNAFGNTKPPKSRWPKTAITAIPTEVEHYFSDLFDIIKSHLILKAVDQEWIATRLLKKIGSCKIPQKVFISTFAMFDGFDGLEFSSKIINAICQLRFPDHDNTTQAYSMFFGILGKVQAEYEKTFDPKKVVSLNDFQAFLATFKLALDSDPELLKQKDLVLAGIFSVLPIVFRSVPEKDIELSLEMIGSYIMAMRRYYPSSSKLKGTLQVSGNLVNRLRKVYGDHKLFSRINTMILKELVEKGPSLFITPNAISSVVTAYAIILDPNIKDQNQFFYCLKKNNFSPGFTHLFMGIHDCITEKSGFSEKAEGISDWLAVQVLGIINPKNPVKVLYYHGALLRRFRSLGKGSKKTPKPRKKMLVYDKLFFDTS